MIRSKQLALLLVGTSMLAAVTGYSQSPFNKGFAYEEGMGNLEPVTDPRGYLICSTLRFGGNDGIMLTRFDSTGTVLFTRGIEAGPLTNVMQYGSLSRMRSDGTLSFLFGSRLWSGNKWSFRIFNTSSEGGINWNRKVEYDSPVYSMIFIGAMEPAFDETPDGGYLITGLMERPASAQIDTVAPIVVKLDGAGNILWNKTYNLGYKVGWHLVSHVDESGGTLLGFHADSVWKVLSDNCILTRMAPNGNTLWSKRVEGLEGRFTGSSKVNGRYVISAMDSASIYILELDTAGVPLGGKRYNMTFPLWTWGAKIIPTLDHGFILTTLRPDISGLGDVFFFKVDSLGALQWQRAYGNEYSQFLVDFVDSGDNTLTMLTGHQIWDASDRYYLSKLDSAGMNDCVLQAVGVSSEESFVFSTVDVVLNEFAPPMLSQPLYANDSLAYDPEVVDTCLFEMGFADVDRENELLVYPNPTSGPTTVRLPADLPGASLAIIDLFGKRTINTVLSRPETLVDLSTLSGGVYLYQVVSQSGRTLSGKLIKE
jgi:hypothetical protein